MSQLRHNYRPSSGNAWGFFFAYDFRFSVFTSYIPVTGEASSFETSFFSSSTISHVTIATQMTTSYSVDGILLYCSECSVMFSQLYNQHNKTTFPVNRQFRVIDSLLYIYCCIVLIIIIYRRFFMAFLFLTLMSVPALLSKDPFMHIQINQHNITTLQTFPKLNSPNPALLANVVLLSPL